MHGKDNSYESRTEKVLADNVQEIADWFVQFYFTFVDTIRDFGHLVLLPTITAIGVLFGSKGEMQFQESAKFQDGGVLNLFRVFNIFALS